MIQIFHGKGIFPHIFPFGYHSPYIFIPKATFIKPAKHIERIPCSWGSVTWSHVTRLHFLFSYFPPCHIKLLMISSICLCELSRTKIIAYWYIGRVDRSALIIITLLAILSHMIPQFWILSFIFSTCLLHTSDLTFCLAIGSPRYVKCGQLACVGISRIWEMFRIILGGVFQPYILHFVLFSIPPEARRNSSRTFLNILAIILDAPPRRRLSLANREWFTFLTLFAIWIPVIFLFFSLIFQCCT